MKHLLFLGFIILELVLLTLLLYPSGPAAANHQHSRAQNKLVSTLMLTDLAIWTEAHYCRHPSQTDFFTPFQDFPGAIEHFPAGSIINPAVLGQVTGRDQENRASRKK